MPKGKKALDPIKEAELNQQGITDKNAEIKASSCIQIINSRTREQLNKRMQQ